MSISWRWMGEKHVWLRTVTRRWPESSAWCKHGLLKGPSRLHEDPVTHEYVDSRCLASVKYSFTTKRTKSSSSMMGGVSFHLSWLHLRMLSQKLIFLPLTHTPASISADFYMDFSPERKSRKLHKWINKQQPGFAFEHRWTLLDRWAFSPFERSGVQLQWSCSLIQHRVKDDVDRLGFRQTSAERKACQISNILVFSSHGVEHMRCYSFQIAQIFWGEKKRKLGNQAFPY